MDILDVDLLRFEKGDAAARRAVVDGVMRSLPSEPPAEPSSPHLSSRDSEGPSFSAPPVQPPQAARPGVSSLSWWILAAGLILAISGVVALGVAFAF